MIEIPDFATEIKNRLIENIIRDSFHINEPEHYCTLDVDNCVYPRQRAIRVGYDSGFDSGWTEAQKHYAPVVEVLEFIVNRGKLKPGGSTEGMASAALKKLAAVQCTESSTPDTED